MSERVYLAQAGECYKIGKSTNPGKRANQFRTPWGNPRLIHVIATADAGWLEKALHGRFAHACVGGEWFRLDGGDVDLVLSLARCDGVADAPWVLESPPATRLPRERWTGSAEALSCRLTDGAREVLVALAGRWGISEAAVVDVAVRQLGRWADSPAPGGLDQDRAAAVAELEATQKPRGRPRKGGG